MTRKRFGQLIVITALAAVTAVAGYRFWRASRPASPTLATVDGAAVTSRDLEIRLAQILPMASFHGNIEPSRLVGLRRAALDDLILDQLIFAEAVRAGRSADPKIVEAEVEKARARFSTDEEYESALAANGLTASTFRRQTERRILISEARQAHADQKVTDGDAQAYYAANADRFMRPEQVHLLELLIKVDPATPASAAPAEKKARAIAARIRAGEPFGPIARDHSEDDYRVKDGDLGFVHRGRLDADLEAAVFAAQPGAVNVIRSLYGFHVFKVVERQAPAQLTFDEARPAILDRMTRERREQAEAAWFSALRAGASITIVDPVLREAAPADLPGFRSTKAMGGR
jgi:peptidyl-prolyl cis-trans isomerase C